MLACCTEGIAVLVWLQRNCGMIAAQDYEAQAGILGAWQHVTRRFGSPAVSERAVASAAAHGEYLEAI